MEWRGVSRARIVVSVKVKGGTAEMHGFPMYFNGCGLSVKVPG